MNGREVAGTAASWLLLLLAAPLAVGAAVQPAPVPAPPALTTPVAPPLPGITGNSILENLMEHNRARNAALLGYSAQRSYALSNTEGHVYAEETVQMDFHEPGMKTFQFESGEGSWLVRQLVFRRLMDDESRTASGAANRRSALSPENYSFRLLGEQWVGSYDCYVVQVTPKRRGMYLFTGKVWLNMPDYGIVRVTGSPDRKLPFLIKRIVFVRQYEKIGSFWLPESDWTDVQVRLIGRRIFSIRHWDYSLHRTVTASRN